MNAVTAGHWRLLHGLLLSAFLSTLVPVSRADAPTIFVPAEETAENRLVRTGSGGSAVSRMPARTGRSESRTLSVLDISFEDAIDLGFDVCQSVFPFDEVNISVDRSAISVTKGEGLRKTMLLLEPALIVHATNRSLNGILYRMTGLSSSGLPPRMDTHRRAFQDHFWKKNRDSISTKVITHFRISSDKGVPPDAPAFVPTSYEGFKKHLEAKSARGAFEGIWRDADGLYTLGIFHTPNDPRFKYQGMVLESRQSNWRPGEIKARWSDLRQDQPATGDYRMRNKALVGLMWDVEKSAIQSLQTFDNRHVILVKAFPLTGRPDLVASSGTAWSITTNGVFVTCHHVVDGADELFVGVPGVSEMPARVLASDRDSDIAVLQVSASRSFVPLPVNFDQASVGERVTAMGYPLPDALSRDLRVTEGVISAEFGVERDVKQYQISVPVEPGNSGGPLIDESGSVVGVVAAKLGSASPYKDVDNINFAAKTAYLRPLLDAARVVLPPPTTDGSTFSPKEINERYRDSVFFIWTQ